MVSAKKDERPPEMTLSLEAADRKERLLALRRRKDEGAGDDAEGPRYASLPLLTSSLHLRFTQPSAAAHSHSATETSTPNPVNPFAQLRPPPQSSPMWKRSSGVLKGLRRGLLRMMRSRGWRNLYVAFPDPPVSSSLRTCVLAS